jgi:hypothetical protein
MTISKRGEADVLLDGDTYQLVWKYETLLAIEEAMGGLRSIDELFLNGHITRMALAEGVRCGMFRHYGKRKTRKDIARMIGKTMDQEEGAHDRISRAVIMGVLAANGLTKVELDRIERELDDESGHGDRSIGKERDSADPTPKPVVSISTG